jgi:ATP-dependent Zn protease
VPGRSSECNRRIAGHEIGHAFTARALGNNVHHVTIVRGPHFEGRCIRSGPATDLVFAEDHLQTDEIISTCDRLAAIAPELGSGRIADSESVVRGQSMVIELMAGAAAEEVLFPRQRNLGAKHDQIEAHAFAIAAVATQPAAKALLRYAYAEAKALICANRDIVNPLVEALIEFGTLSGAEIDTIVAAAMTARAIKKEHRRRDELALARVERGNISERNVKCRHVATP